ncbi:MAG TPA: bacteriophage holin [Amycolatopsis sp.]|uniref:bacteriophage holin n=1 Tax=Amycolatopsis sp. TaxID=37632 RepID=UPI002B49F98D|nr:bacteriophage holin [Amycolatopsis sp.]HKS45631.1 bacteriophage holin [Amycolatopsis sp.]
MSYLPSIALAVLGLGVLGVLAVRMARGLRRFRSTLSMVVTNTNDRTGLIRARAAGVRVAIDQRRRKPANQ